MSKKVRRQHRKKDKKTPGDKSDLPIKPSRQPRAFYANTNSTTSTLLKEDCCIYRGLPPINSDHLRTSVGMPSCLGSFLLMHSAKRMAVCGSMNRGIPKSTAFRPNDAKVSLVS